MLLLDPHNTADYLRVQGWIEQDEMVSVETLAGGVSNQVLYITRIGNDDFVVKQARPQLRVKAPWFCSVERIWREVEVLQICGELLDTDAAQSQQPATPRILHQDREQFAFAMTAAPRNHRVWRADLLAGQADDHIAAECGLLLGRLHARSWNNPAVAARLDDRKVFDELRIDPYYRTVERLVRETADCNYAQYFERLVESVSQHRMSLVHADFSPKNLLVFNGGLMMVDFETGHYGDPAFDIGFFLSHLLLKSFYHAGRHQPFLHLATTFAEAYRAEVEPVAGCEAFAALDRRAMQNLAGCAWARLDGKSPVDYLVDARRREKLRHICQQIFVQEPTAWQTVCGWCDELLTHSD